MHAQVLATDYTHDGEWVKTIETALIHFFIVFGEDLLSEAEVFCALARLMIASQQIYFARVVDFGCQQGYKNFYRVTSSVHIVTQTQITNFLRVLLLHYIGQVVELSMNITEDGGGKRDFDNIRLFF